MQGIPQAHLLSSSTSDLSPQPLWTSFLTPHKVAVFILLEMYLDLPEDCPTAFRRGLVSLLLDETSLTSHGTEDRTLPDLLDNVSAIPYPGRPVTPSEELLSKVVKSATSMANMFDAFEPMASEVENVKCPHLPRDEDSVLFGYLRRQHSPSQTIDESLTAARFSARSPFGYFIRLVLADVEELTDDFGVAGDFFEALRRYAYAADPTLMSNIDKSSEMSAPTVLSTVDAERFLDAQVDALEDSRIIIGPAALQPKIELYGRQGMIVKAAWTSYLNCLRASDLPSALENLLRYFTFLEKDHFGQANKWVQHYALFNMASLCARFNHIDMALKMVNVAIRRALEMKDDECLMSLQNLKSRLQSRSDAEDCLFSDYGEMPPERDELDHEQASMRSVTALGHARRNLETSSDPERVFEMLSIATNLNCAHDLDTLMGTGRLTRADAWKAFGRHDLAGLHAQMYLQGDKDASADDKPVGLCLLALQYGAQAQYEKVLEIMHAAKRAYPPFASGNAADKWISTLMDICFQRALRRFATTSISVLSPTRGSQLIDIAVPASRCEMYSAEAFASHYAAIAEGDPHMAPSVRMHQALIDLKWGRLSEAYTNLTGLIKDIGGPDARNKALLVECNLQIVELHLESDNALAALPRVLESLTLASQCNYNFLRDRAAIAFAKVATDLEDTHYHAQALAAIESVMPSVYAGENLDVTADAELTLVETKMLSESFLTAGQEDLAQMLKMTESAEKGYRKLEDLDGMNRALTTKAFLLRKAGRTSEGEATAGEVRALDATKKVRIRAPAPRNISAAVVGKSVDDNAMAALFGIRCNGTGR
ncbi:Anaphase-promoting complex subunit 5 [Geranomyces variabilis]|nr:Anaphase-promoting complex subunit 5 [Geranomyces variabilis]